MKKLFLLSTLILSTLGGSVFGQVDFSKWSIGAFPSLLQYHNTEGNEFFDLDNSSLGIDLGVGYDLNSSFMVEGHFMGGKLDYAPSDSAAKTFDSDIFTLNAQLHYMFDNGYILKEDACVAPFLFAGIGGIRSKEGFGAVVPLGGGLKFRIDDLFSIQLRSSYNLATRDEYNYLQHTLGFVWKLGSDGMTEKKPKDSDGDGIVDKMDKCPDVAGVESNQGCPEVVAEPKDSDGDGIVDASDKCPNVPGVLANGGCPELVDSDNDGIPDNEDKCPNYPGVKSNDGCPEIIDTDKDGIADANDKCPTVYGVASNEGCPEILDADKDGIADADDKCPNEFGIIGNNGCPEVDNETKEVLDLAIEGIQFETSRDVIKTESYAILARVVTIMNTHPAYNLSIEGHTDSQGNDDMNLDLSKRRAAAAKTYLVNKGINGSRITSDGFGETRPRDTNETAAGRARNRRCELQIKF